MQTRSFAAALITLIATTTTSVAQWTVTNLHPAGGAWSYAYAANGGEQVGFAYVGGASRASIWSGTVVSRVDLNPAGALYSYAYSTSGGQQAGQAYVGGVQRASVWSGTSASWVDLNPAGSTDSRALAVSGGHQVGYAEVGGVIRASLWSGTAGSWVDLHPPNASQSSAAGISGGHQVGYVTVGGLARASLWNGTAISRVDLHPTNATESAALAASDGQQAGFATVNGEQHASLWTGTAASWVDLNPVGASWSRVNAVSDGQQAGYAFVTGQPYASLWNGTAASWVNLHAFVPAEFSSSEAEGISSDGVNTYVSGWGYNSITGRHEALLWTRPLTEPWTVVNLNPEGATESRAYAASGAQQAGYATVEGPPKAGMWSGTSSSWGGREPNYCSAYAYGMSNGQIVGSVNFCGFTGAALWSSASFVEITPALSLRSTAYGISGGQIVGFSEMGEGYRASLWSGTPGSWVNLNPAASSWSVAYAVGGGQQAGFARVGGADHASLWTGTVASWVDLHAANASQSYAFAASGGQQAGYVIVDGVDHASLWSSTATSWVDLHPEYATQSRAYAASGGQQAGYARVGGADHASLWTGTAASWVDLHAFVPAEFSSSYARGISSDSVRTYIAGYGYNTLTGRDEALLWKSICFTPSITSHPTPSNPLPGASSSFTVAAGGSEPITYQWRKNESPLVNGGRFSGVDTPAMAITNVQASDQGTYDCVVTDACSSSTSNGVDLSCRPIIVQQPATASAIAAGLQLSVSIPLGAVNTYRWRQNGQNLFNIPGLFSGVTTRTLTLLAADPSLVGTYDCVLTNVCGTTPSTSGTVYCPADLDNGSGTGIPDGGIDITDLIYFLGAFEAGSPAADLDDGTGNGISDGGVDISDLLFFLERFEAGC